MRVRRWEGREVIESMESLMRGFGRERELGNEGLRLSLGVDRWIYCVVMESWVRVWGKGWYRS